MLGVEDGRVGKGPEGPSLGDVAVGGLGDVDVVPASVVGRVLAPVRSRFPALGRQVEVVFPTPGALQHAHDVFFNIPA